MRRYEYAAKTKLRGTGINCGLIVLLFAVVLLLGQVLPQNTYRRVLVPIIWQMCIFILLGTSLNLTLGYLGQLTLGHMGFAGVGAYTAALTSLALERAGLFEASKAAPGQLILVILGCCLLRCHLRRAARPARGHPGAAAAR
ncbi:MAG: hypothetical protein ACLTR5_05080 [Oscillospiraceae bacterium]